MSEKTRADETIAKAARERKCNCPKNAGKMQFFIGTCGNRRYFSGFFGSRRFEWNSVIFFSACGDSMQKTGERSMGTAWKELEESISAAVTLRRRAVALGFLDAAPARLEKFAGSEPSGCSFWRLAAAGRSFYTVPENHFNCAVGASTHNIPLSPAREKETEQTLQMMFDWLCETGRSAAIPTTGKDSVSDCVRTVGRCDIRTACGFVCLQARRGHVVTGSGWARGDWERSACPGAADVHGFAGDLANAIDFESGTHGEPGVYGTGRR
jgi:hypothetical protein